MLIGPFRCTMSAWLGTTVLGGCWRLEPFKAVGVWAACLAYLPGLRNHPSIAGSPVVRPVGSFLGSFCWLDSDCSNKSRQLNLAAPLSLSLSPHILLEGF